MTQEELPEGAVIDTDKLPAQFPTHCNDAAFWESLGRVVATFGFLEEVLGKAIFSFTAKKTYDGSEINDAFKKWSATLKRALNDPLSGLIKSYEKAVLDHPEAKARIPLEDFKSFITHLREATVCRNVLCHGSWREYPDENGASVPLFTSRDMKQFSKPINCQLLDELQREIALLTCEVINSVTRMGWQFPGSSGPGESII